MAWSGVGLSQDDFMKKDEVIVVDMDDKIIGHDSKYNTHVYNKETPRGNLHRAFSVFLFNSQGKLLLQQRAADKITFPKVWTNTCCSHQLYGYSPNEVDDDASIAAGSVNGAKAAAVRKLEHELGIKSPKVQIKNFKFLTRLHYWAADVLTHGKKSPWGEHEIDYILFIKADIKLKPNPEEVMDTKYVSLSELQEMMQPSSGLLWSPWFKIIAEKFLVHWWKDLDETLTTSKYVDVKSIHRFDPTPEHFGGGGDAGEWLGRATSPYEKREFDVGSKQGAYGKVKIHKHSKIGQLLRIDEVFAAFWLISGAKMPNKIDKSADEDTLFCDEFLGKVSRSFAAVIRQLPKGLCKEILIFYLVLRALDTIEDDMEAFKGKEHVKIEHLNNFYNVALETEGWNMQGVGEGDEKTFLSQFHRCGNVFRQLSKDSQIVISDITKRMGQGMAYYVGKDLGQGTVKIEDYNLYCHYVAGLVGEGLSRLFTCTGYESREVANVSTTLANTMGLFLQKTNIIRDYLEDFVDGRAFWPQEVWKKYSKTGNLGDFASASNIEKAVECLNHLVTDALHCVPECMEYMKLLKTEEVFRFCAIPQVMAIATLADLYDNPNVFTGVVKIRKGLAAKLILDTKTPAGLHKWFNFLTKKILSKVKDKDPNSCETKAICNKIIQITSFHARIGLIDSYSKIFYSLSPIGMAMSAYHIKNNPTLVWNDFVSFFESIKALTNPSDQLAVGIFVGLALFFVGYTLNPKDTLKRADP